MEVVVDADNPVSVLMFCLDLVDGEEWSIAMQEATHKERLKMLKDNGFTISKVKLK